jgi:uncharacterized protein (DUF1499 family)
MTDPVPASEPESRPARTGRIAPVALGVAVVAALMVLLAGPGTRAGLWHFRTGFSLLRYGAYLGVAAVLLAIAAIAMRRRGERIVLAVIALLLALPAFFVPWRAQRTARNFPPIHDITTDTRNPPEFARLLEERERTGATNPAVHEGDSVAAMQREAYPDVQPVMMAMAPDSAFTLAFNTARDMGWEIAEADAAQGRIEATATTRWFGFRDDVVIRLRPASGITRLDIRSVSRVGRGDVGANAARVREYVRRLPGKVRM